MSTATDQSRTVRRKRPKTLTDTEATPVRQLFRGSSTAGRSLPATRISQLHLCLRPKALTIIKKTAARGSAPAVARSA